MRVAQRFLHVGLACGLGVGLILLASAQGLRAQTDPALGTWKLNLAKSKYNPGPAPLSEMRTYEAFGAGGVKATFNRVDAAGKKIAISYSALYDGKDSKYTGPDADTIALKRIDANTIEATLKSGGKVAQTSKTVISPDGKVRTLTTMGTDATGQKYNNLVVFDKQ